MRDVWGAIEAISFELVPAGRSRCMLRVEGRTPGQRGSSGPRPALVIEHGGTEHRFDPLPAPEDPPGVLRAGYSVPMEILAPDSRYRLAQDAGEAIMLPTPSKRPVATPPEAAQPAPSPDDHPVAARTDELERLVAERVALQIELDEAREQLRIVGLERNELVRRASACDQAASVAHAQVVELEGENRRLRSDLEELEVWRGELERRLADTTNELAAARSRGKPTGEGDFDSVVEIAARRALEQAERELREALAQRTIR